MGSSAVFLGGGIRARVWKGIGGLLLVLLLTASLAVWISLRGNDAIEQTFKNNGDSLAYMHELTRAADQVDAWVQVQTQSSRAADPSAILNLKSQVDKNLNGELENVTENGEREAALDLRSSWETYMDALPAVLRPGLDPGQRRALYRARLAPAHARLRELAWVIADLNLKNAHFKNHGKDLLLSELRLMILMLVAGLALGVAFAVRLGRSVVDPLLALTDGVRALGRGRLGGQVAVAGNDEMGELGKAFNVMARRLHDYEQGFRAKLLRTQRTTQLAINSFSDPVAVLGLDHKVELCNRAAEHLFGLKPGSELKDGPLADLTGHLEPVLTQGVAYEPEAYSVSLMVRSQGRERHILPRLLPVKDAKGRIVGATLVLTDVTARRKLDGMKSGLLATVSHELKNPLTSLRMAAHLLEEEFNAGRVGRQANLLATLKGNAERLHSALEGLLDLGRLESGDLLRLELKPADEMLRTLLAPLLPPLEQQGFRLELALDKALPPVAVDLGRLKLVFSNLLDNAARHSPPSGTIKVGAALEASGVRFWVQDEGPGIPKSFENKIFERFFRVPGQAQGSGLGLGLAIAREITELHGGYLVLDPGPKGARFSFILPLAGRTLLSVQP